MIEIGRNKEEVEIKVNLSIGWYVNFKYGRHSELDAILLTNQIRKDLSNHIEKIRRQAYELGWKDAKSRKVKKKTEFIGNINSNTIGY